MAKHFAFTRCGELNVYGIVDAQIAAIEGELFELICLCAKSQLDRIYKIDQDLQENSVLIVQKLTLRAFDSKEAKRLI